MIWPRAIPHSSNLSDEKKMHEKKKYGKERRRIFLKRSINGGFTPIKYQDLILTTQLELGTPKWRYYYAPTRGKNASGNLSKSPPALLRLGFVEAR